MARSSARVNEASSLDHVEGLERGFRVGRGEDASRLGPDGDGGDVVSDRVVQLAGQLQRAPGA